MQQRFLNRENFKSAIHTSGCANAIRPTKSLAKNSSHNSIRKNFAILLLASIRNFIHRESTTHTIILALVACTSLLVYTPTASALTRVTLSPPLTIEAENFGTSQGIRTETTSDIGGGLDVGYIDAGDWFSYVDTVIISIPTTGNYIISYRVSSRAGGGVFQLIDDIKVPIIVDQITVPKTGGWQVWTTVEKTLTLKGGRYFFKINSLIGGFNINWFKITPALSANSPSNSAALISSSSSSKSSSLSSISAWPASSSSSSSSSSISSSAYSSNSPLNSSSAANTNNSLSSKSSAISSSKSSSSLSSVAINKPNSLTGLVTIAGPIGLSWSIPNKRQDGTALDVTEIGGYQIRYKKPTDLDFTFITINDAWTITYNFTWLEGDYIFQIATFDKKGVFSNYVDFAGM